MNTAKTTRTSTTAAIALVCILAACGLAPGPDIAYQPPTAPQRVQGCASGTGYELSDTAAACTTLSRLTATVADLGTACSSGWAPCPSPPAGCEALSSHYIGAEGWRTATSAAWGCGPGPAGAVPVALGCGQGAQGEVAPRCGAGRSSRIYPMAGASSAARRDSSRCACGLSSSFQSTQAVFLPFDKSWQGGSRSMPIG